MRIWNYVFLVRLGREILTSKYMPVRKQGEENIRKITKVGKTSFAVTLPIEMLRQLGWREKQKVVVKRIKGGLEIRDYKNK